MVQVPNEVLERLYSAHPGGFVAARKEAAATARAAGDAARAQEITQLPKPTVAAWLVNLLAWRRPDLVAELAELSAHLRAAQRELRGPQLRELSAQRRAAVAGLVAEAKALAAREAPDVSAAKLPLAEVETTLSAALADEEVAGLVRSGRLVRSVAYAGFGEVPRPQLRLVTGGVEEVGRPAGRREVEEGAEAARARKKAEERADAARLAAARRELTAARTAARKAEAAQERATAAESEAAQALAAVEAELAELERRRGAAEAELGRRKLARKSAQREVVAARRYAGEAEAAVEALASTADRGGAARAQTGG